MNDSILKNFSNPSSQYRGAPFWAWNGKLDPVELRRQIRLMHRMGLGGFFMHSRVGLATPYLSEEWFDCVNACIDEAERLGMYAWLYDEDRWPSGAAGGLVTRNPKYRMRCLIMETLDKESEFHPNRGTVAVFTGQIGDTSARDIKQAKDSSRPRPARGEAILHFFTRLEACSAWYNGQTYLDTMNPAAVREFIKTTHEAYRKNAGKHFGRRVPGIFTDEPNYGQMCRKLDDGGISVPWTDALPVVFKHRYGYDLIPHLPELFLDIDGNEMSRARLHYHDCITHLFVDAFARQTGEWCEKNSMLYTGHALCEETLASQTTYVGSAMRFYEYMQAPGMDILTERWREYDTAKQVSSVARQFDRKWRLTETYGCTGWDFPFRGHKAIGDWQAALGINVRCQHLAWYTMEGQAKRDYPACIFYQSPWWELYRKVEDYFARIHAVMTRGVEVRDLLVIHPVESMWTLYRKGSLSGNHYVEAYDRMFIALRDSLLAENIDFDYGDEDILARHARVWKSQAGVPLLHVGKATYKAVVVPPLKTMRPTTLRLLQGFHAQGGAVVFAGSPPKYVDALPSDAVMNFARLCAKAPASGKGLAAAVAPVARRISITDDAGKEIKTCLHLLREDKDAFYLFVCNTGHGPGQIKPSHLDDTMTRDRQTGYPEVYIRGLPCGQGLVPLELDPESGNIFRADARRLESHWEIRTSLQPVGSRLFVVPRNNKALSGTYPIRPQFNIKRAIKLGAPEEEWDIILSENNVLVLDRPRYRIGEGAWKGPDEILRVDGFARDALHVPRRGGDMVQPWAREPGRAAKSAPVTLAYDFEATVPPSGDLFLGLERPDTFRVTLNGAPINLDVECGWWCDRSLRKAPINPALLRMGRNELVLICDYHESHPGLEIVYLLGNFGVQVKGTTIAMTRLPTRLRIGDWVKQGLAFFSGSVSYCRKIKTALRGTERLFVEIPDYRGAAVRILVDGEEAGIIAWEPNELDITSLVKGRKTADLRIEVVGHRRNSHGPLHHANKWPLWTGPHEFVSSGEQWTDAYQLVPCGLMKAPRLTVRAVSGMERNL